MGASSKVGIIFSWVVRGAAVLSYRPAQVMNLCSGCAAAALEEDDVTEVSLDRLGSGSKNTTEEPESPIWIYVLMGDVFPFPLSLI